MLHIWSHLIKFGMRYVGGMKVEFRGLQHLPLHGPALLASKHQSECDGILLSTLIPNISLVAMKQLFSYPVVGTLLYKLQMIRVDTDGGPRARANLAKFSKIAADNKRTIVIYPEGRLMQPGYKSKYRTGIYYLYRDLNLPVVPVATCVGMLWDRHSFKKVAGTAAVEFLPPIEPGLSKDEFMAKLESTVEEASARLLSEFSGKPYAESMLSVEI